MAKSHDPRDRKLPQGPSGGTAPGGPPGSPAGRSPAKPTDDAPRRPTLGERSRPPAARSGRPPPPGRSGSRARPTPGSAHEDPTVVVTARGAERVNAGHLWVYRSDVSAHPGTEGGAAVRVVDERGHFLGRAFYGQHSQIALRLTGRQDEVLDEEFFERRLMQALTLRDAARPDPERVQATRLVHGESDGLPGLIVDRYADCLSIQTLTEAMEARRELVVELLFRLASPRAIVERNDVKAREHENLPLRKGLLRGELSGPVAYREGEVTLVADLLEGQKTGAFLDQGENHVESGKYARGRALDCFSYGGGFGLQLARGGAESVTAIDISEKAVEDGKRAAAQNGLTNIEFKLANAFDFLRDQSDAGERYDTIVLDPPAFAKSKTALEPALRGYKEINLRALHMLNPGGVLVTSSCSYHVGAALFEDTVRAAACDAGRTVQLFDARGAGRDHPALLGMPETRYLKCLFLRVL